ncbi:hypothetical protein K449DRAFT_435053 [Hypoxylon sp. EC38]|nr:hypothetical protein K449DRAFT_435053 [Hypoxylon sp. EC38]
MPLKRRKLPQKAKKKRKIVKFVENDESTWYANWQPWGNLVPNSPHSAPKEDEAIRLSSQLRDHLWDNPTWEFEKVIATGFRAVTVLVRHRESELDGKTHRRLVLKRSITPEGDHETFNEIIWYNRLRGSEHIVNMITARYDGSYVPPANAGDENAKVVPFFQRLIQRPINPKKIRKPNDPRRIDEELGLARLAGIPVVVLEYLENGTFNRIIERAIRYNSFIPNRLLWSFFLCMVRSCVAMAYPPNRAPGKRTVLETIPAVGTVPSPLIHNSLHCGNIMFGAPDRRFDEHRFAPVVKFIDLGAAEDRGGPQLNLEHVSIFMICLITNNKEPDITTTTMYNDTSTKATAILPPNDKKYQQLDPDLRDFLARCLASEVYNRPNLQETLETIENALRTKTPETFPFNIAPSETDDAIKGFLQKLVYDADDILPEEPFYSDGRWWEYGEEEDGGPGGSGSHGAAPTQPGPEPPPTDEHAGNRLTEFLTRLRIGGDRGPINTKLGRRATGRFVETAIGGFWT